jgi:hypothetical protein
MPFSTSLRSRIERLESQIAPPSRVFVFTGAPHADDDDRSHAERLAQFKSEKGVGPHDTLVTVVFTFDA